MNSNRDTELRTCIICGLDKIEGLKIHSGFICESCEKEIVHTEVNNAKYSFFIRRMKELWLKNA